jgi:hypothetical protein
MSQPSDGKKDKDSRLSRLSTKLLHPLRSRKRSASSGANSAHSAPSDALTEHPGRSNPRTSTTKPNQVAPTNIGSSTDDFMAADGSANSRGAPIGDVVAAPTAVEDSQDISTTNIATTTAVETAQLPSDKSTVPLEEGNTAQRTVRAPIWEEAMEVFKKKEPELHRWLKDSLEKWESNDIPTSLGSLKVLEEPTVDKTKWRTQWAMRLQPYLPSLRTVKPLVMSISSLDPHKIAPFVCAGIFVAIEVICVPLLDSKDLRQ